MNNEKGINFNLKDIQIQCHLIYDVCAYGTKIVHLAVCITFTVLDFKHKWSHRMTELN